VGLGLTLPVVPQFIEDDFGGGGVAVGLGVGAMAVSAALLRPLVGRLGDERGRRILVIGGSAVVGISILGYHLADSLVTFLPFRLLTGVGEAAMFVGAATAAQDLAPDHRRGEAASIFSVALYGGLAVGPVIGDSVYAEWGAGPVWTIAAVCLGVAVALGFLVPSDRPSQPQRVPGERKRFLHPAAIWPGMVLFCGLYALVAFTAFLPLYVDDIASVDRAGIFFLGYGALILVIRLFGATIPDRFGSIPTATLALGALGGGMIAFFVAPNLAGLWIGTLIFAVGQALLFPSMFVRVVNQAPETERSHAVGTFSLFFDLSQGVGALVLGVVVAQSSNRGAFAAGAIATVVGMVILRAVVARTHPARAENQRHI
jgi:predicted MFS family arabinose efflux permease